MRMLGAGDVAPDLELLSLEGKRQPLAALWSGGAAVLVLFKVSCPVCQLALPFLERISHGSLRIAGVSQDNAAATASFRARFGVTFSTLIDDSEGGYAASNALGITSVPSVFVVEPDGVISKSFAGFSKQALEELGQRAGSPPFRPEDNVPAWKAG